MSDPPKRILVLTIRAIGDVALMTPIFRLLKEKFPAGYVAALADGPSAQVLHYNPHIDRLFTIDRTQSRQLSGYTRLQEWVDLVTKIRREQFDCVIDLFSGPRSALLARLSGAPLRYGEDVRKGLRGFLYTHPIKVVRDCRHLVEQKLELIRPLIGHVSRDRTYLELFPTEDEQKSAERFLSRNDRKNRFRVGLIPGAGSRWRIWPAERFAELGDWLIREHDVDLYLLGGNEEITVCRQVEELMEAQPMNLSGKTTLRELMALLGKLDVVVSNVTGPMHLASACSKPRVVGLYGEADTVQYAPWGDRAQMVTKGEVRKAYWDKVDYQRDYELLRQITVTDVMEVLNKIMTREN